MNKRTGLLRSYCAYKMNGLDDAEMAFIWATRTFQKAEDSVRRAYNDGKSQMAIARRESYMRTKLGELIDTYSRLQNVALSEYLLGQVSRGQLARVG